MKSNSSSAWTVVLNMAWESLSHDVREPLSSSNRAVRKLFVGMEDEKPAAAAFAWATRTQQCINVVDKRIADSKMRWHRSASTDSEVALREVIDLCISDIQSAIDSTPSGNKDATKVKKALSRLKSRMSATVEILDRRDKFKVESVNLKNEVRRQFSELSDLIDETSSVCTVKGGATAYTVRGQLRSLLSNLIQNAIIHNDSDPPVLSVQIWEQAGSRGPLICLEFRDNGPGMPKNSGSKIFSLSYSEPRTNSAKRRSTGTGLAICAVATEVLEGQLSVVSSGKKGTLMRLVIPMIHSKEHDYG